MGIQNELSLYSIMLFGNKSKKLWYMIQHGWILENSMLSELKQSQGTTYSMIPLYEKFTVSKSIETENRLMMT